MKQKPKVLNLTIKKEYFELIKSGKKTVEYRAIKPYYFSRFEGKTYDRVIFRNGYSADAPKICLQVLKIKRTPKCYEIHLGKRIRL